MAQLNISLDQDEIMSLLAGDRDGAFRLLLERTLNGVLKAESEAQLHAAPSERTAERTDYRNGTRGRGLVTRLGRVELEVPRHRNVPFKTLLFDNYQRSEAALLATMAQMVVEGVSTRKVAAVVEQLCGQAPSKSQVSEVCADLDDAVAAFRSRPLDGSLPFLMVDATYFKVRGQGRVSPRALLVACGLDADGRRSVLGFTACQAESEETWTAFLEDLKRRGLKTPLLVVSDAHSGLRRALHRALPGVPWQRCQFHFSRNISGRAPRKWQAGLRGELTGMFNSDTIEEARAACRRIADDYRDEAPDAVKCLEEGFEDAMTVMALPRGIRQFLRTNNHIERLNRELKRRSTAIGIFPNEQSLIRLMGSVLIEQDGRQHAMRAAYSRESYSRLLASDTPSALKRIAQEQEAMLLTA